ncbi:hypothetical protein [Vibrio harveyi]|uniref:hypothetical protein n=1 Tax=Vibrio harveyi TaxID=669 RepID=UPI002480FF43|nr:hypothetical protein [Vibrio harveyi]
MSNTPLDNATKTASKKKNYIVAFVLVFLALAIMAYIYARAAQQAPDTIKNNRTPQSNITEPASKPNSASKDGATPLDSDSPAKRVADEQERIAKKNATEQGNSHMDSTAAIQEKTARHEEAKKPPQPPEPPKRKGKQDSKQNPQSKETVTREQLIAQRMKALFTANPALPPPPDYSGKVKNMFDRIGRLPTTVVAYEKAQDQLYKTSEENTQRQLTENRAGGQKISRVESLSKRSITSTNEQNQADKTTETELVFSLGQMVLTELRWQVISDYSLPVFFDVVEPPFKKITMMGSFEMTQRQDGVLLRVTNLQIGKEVLPVSGYGVNIATDLSPLFDHDVDTHFAERFLARASTAFVAPWLDFVGGSTTTVDGGSTIIVKDPVTKTKDRIVGGLANVAKEFLPDLRKNANIPPTVKVPDGYPVGIVFTSQVFLPKALLENTVGGAYSSIIGEYQP